MTVTIDKIITKADSDAFRFPLKGEFHIPKFANGLILIPEVQPTQRFAEENRFIARQLNNQSFGTFQFRMLKEQECQNPSFLFAYDLMTKRLKEVIQWLTRTELDKGLPIGVMGSDSCVPALFREAAMPDSLIKAIVAKEGYLINAASAMAHVTSPTLLIYHNSYIGLSDTTRKGYNALPGDKKLAIMDNLAEKKYADARKKRASQYVNQWFHVTIGKEMVPNAHHHQPSFTKGQSPTAIPEHTT